MILNPNKLVETIKEIDPDRIYVENIRSVLGTSTRVAKWVCELAVKKGFFIKKYALICQNEDCERVISTFSSLMEIPNELTCFICEDEKRIKSTFKKEELELLIYYTYVKGSYSLA